MSALFDEFKEITDRHRAERDELHEAQCEDYRNQISMLKDMNTFYHDFIQRLHKESLKVDPMVIWGGTANPILGPGSNWGGIIPCSEAAIKTNVGS